MSISTSLPLLKRMNTPLHTIKFESATTILCRSHYSFNITLAAIYQSHAKQISKCKNSMLPRYSCYVLLSTVTRQMHASTQADMHAQMHARVHTCKHACTLLLLLLLLRELEYLKIKLYHTR